MCQLKDEPGKQPVPLDYATPDAASRVGVGQIARAVVFGSFGAWMVIGSLSIAVSHTGGGEEMIGLMIGVVACLIALDAVWKPLREKIRRR